MPMLPTTVLVFWVAGARLGLRVEAVSEVLPLVALRRAPETPAPVAGFLALDGRMIPVLHLEKLLRLDLEGTGWDPLGTLSNRIVVAEMPDGPLAWIAGPEAGLAHCEEVETVRLPPGHILNRCAQWVIARQPPEPSIVVLEPERLLLEKERACIEGLRERAQERLAALAAPADEETR